MVEAVRRDITGWMTLNALVEEINGRGFEVSPRTIGYWQSKGHIDYPVRRWVNGAPRAFYPPDSADRIVEFINDRLESGHHVLDLKPDRDRRSALLRRIEELERRVAELEGRADG